MGKDVKKKEPAGKGKGKQAAGASDEGASKGGKGDKLGTCNFVKARHILCEKQGKINEVYQKLQEGWLDSGDKVPPAEFGKAWLPHSIVRGSEGLMKLANVTFSSKMIIVLLEITIFTYNFLTDALW